MRTGRTRCPMVLPTNALSPATSGTTPTSSPNAHYGMLKG